MTDCFISEIGYYIKGKSIELAGSTPNLDDEGEKKYDDLQHLYLVLIAALAQLKGHKDLVHVYSDSRLIEDFRGGKTLSAWFDRTISLIRQNIISEIHGAVFFRKKPATEIVSNIREGLNNLEVVSPAREARLKANVKAAMRSKAQELKNRWFDAKQ